MTSLLTSVAEIQTNPSQWKAFQAHQEHCVVLAPPGSGKTKLLTTRMAYDLVNRIPEPHGAACITLTNAATDELRRRVEALGVSRRPNLFVGTVHSFALRRVIAPFAAMVERPDLANITIASTAQTRKAMTDAIKAVFRGSGDAGYVESTIEINRKRFADAATWAKAGPRVQEVSRRYLDNLHNSGVRDFIEIVEIAVWMVEAHPTVQRVLKAKYPRLYVDEYQDLPPGLDRLVQALCFGESELTCRLFAVGDSDQSIFGFTGSQPELLDRLASRTDVHTVHLDLNYRSANEIIRIASRMKQSPTVVTGLREGGSVEAIYSAGGFEAQCSAAAVRARQLNLAGTSLHEVAVLCSTHDHCQTAAKIFRQNGVAAFYRESDYRLTMATRLVEACASWAVLGYENSSHRLGDILSQWRTLLDRGWTRAADVNLVELLMAFKDQASLPARQFLDAILSAGLNSPLRRVEYAEEALEVKNMKTALSTGVLQDASIRDLADRARRTDRVEITTMSSSKGLEFDHVCILGADQKQIPHFGALRDQDQMAEERRKFYVSITRARESVRIYYSGFVRWKSGSIGDAGPSQFLKELGLL